VDRDRLVADVLKNPKTLAAVCDTLSTMRAPHSAEHRTRLLPAGRRWGFGAHSVLPYLTALHTRPVDSGQEPAEAIRNPVFPQMDAALRGLRQRH
jgi:hypothetical protein